MTPHDKLLSERELCQHYGVSRTTVRLALQELETQGYIYRRHGKEHMSLIYQISRLIWRERIVLQKR